MRSQAIEVLVATGVVLILTVPLSADRTADQPDSWLVLYNANVADSGSWAAWFATEWGIPTSHVLGLDASAAEHLQDAAAAETQVFGPVRRFLADNPAIAEKVMGIVVGYRVPGHYGSAMFGVGGSSIASGLQDLRDDAINLNPANPRNCGLGWLPAARLTRAAMAPDHYMVARIDAPSLAAAQAITLRAKTILNSGGVLSGAWVYYDYTDPFLPEGIWPALRNTVLNPVFAGLAWRAYDEDTEQTPDDAFRFGTHDVRGWNDGRLRGNPAGPRILAYDMNSWGATTVRSTTADAGRFVPNAIDAGYVAALGCTGEPGSIIGPYPDTLLASLMLGWTLGEAFYLANPYDDFMWTLVGDPFLRIPDWVRVPSDFDADGDVDSNDFARFQACFNGPLALPATDGCDGADLDRDGDVDVTDFGRFQACFSGSGIYAVPGCEQ